MVLDAEIFQHPLLVASLFLGGRYSHHSRFERYLTPAIARKSASIVFLGVLDDPPQFHTPLEEYNRWNSLDVVGIRLSQYRVSRHT
jgi:hypothetical protein